MTRIATFNKRSKHKALVRAHPDTEAAPTRSATLQSATSLTMSTVRRAEAGTR